MFNFLKNLRSPEKRFGTGLVLDKRTLKEKERDYFASEILPDIMKAPAWVEKSKEQWRRFEPIFNQVGSSSCVGQTVALSMGIENYLEEAKFVPLSARFIYAQGYELGGGMYYAKAFDIAKKQGAPPEQLMPSQNLGEDKMVIFDAKESDKQVALVYKPNSYIYLPIDFDTIAGIVDQGKPVLLGTSFDNGGFQLEIQLTPNGVYGHAVTVVDRTLWKGKRALVIQNSWGTGWGYGGLGVITEEQAPGLVMAAYFEELSNAWRDKVPEIQKPKYFFANNLSFRQYNNEISKLQECLRYEGLFPTTVDIKTPAYYGNITAKAVLEFQKKYQVASEEELNSLQGRIVGPKTRERLNQIFN